MFYGIDDVVIIMLQTCQHKTSRASFLSRTLMMGCSAPSRILEHDQVIVPVTSTSAKFICLSKAAKTPSHVPLTSRMRRIRTRTLCLDRKHRSSNENGPLNAQQPVKRSAIIIKDGAAREDGISVWRMMQLNGPADMSSIRSKTVRVNNRFFRAICAARPFNFFSAASLSCFVRADLSKR